MTGNEQALLAQMQDLGYFPWSMRYSHSDTITVQASCQ